MTRNKALLTLIFLCIALLSSCNNISSTQQPTTTDSTALRIAILPIRECEILRQAKNDGLADMMGLNMELIEYDALMNIDTALLNGRAHIYFEDSTRIALFENDSLQTERLTSIPIQVSLITNKDKNITSPSSLETKMVGVTRHSILGEWMNSICQSYNISSLDVYHAQINSIPVRYSMIKNGLIDAAIMPYPWADSLVASGHQKHCDTTLYGMGFYINTSITDDTLRQRQILLFKKLLNNIQP